MKKIFIGTPQVSAYVLENLINKGIFFDAVITSTDKPVGRKGIITPPPVKNIAVKYGLKFFQPKDNKDFNTTIDMILPDYAFVVAYGRIIKREAIEKIKIGFFNLHFSLLPAYRGADPVRWAIINGEKETGVSVFKIDEGLDTGPILLQEKTNIRNDETSAELLSRLSNIGVLALEKAYNMIESGNVKLTPQIGVPSYAPKISVDNTFIDFSKPWNEVYNKIRAFSYDPYARFNFSYNTKKIIIQIISAKGIDANFESFSPGQVCGFEKRKTILVKCLRGCVSINTIKPEGKREMNAYDYFVNGIGVRLGDFII